MFHAVAAISTSGMAGSSSTGKLGPFLFLPSPVPLVAQAWRVEHHASSSPLAMSATCASTGSWAASIPKIVSSVDILPTSAPFMRSAVAGITLPAAKVHGSSETVNGNTFGTAVTAPGDALSSISEAEVYYRRPEAWGTLGVERLEEEQLTEEDKLKEAANGYNPYWDVRLAPVSLEERMVALGYACCRRRRR